MSTINPPAPPHDLQPVPRRQHKAYAPPLAHKVRITTPYVPACATDVRATFARILGQPGAARQARRQQRIAAARAAEAQSLPLFDTPADLATPAGECIAALLVKESA